jgi:hypothetical protein
MDLMNTLGMSLGTIGELHGNMVVVPNFKNNLKFKHFPPPTPKRKRKASTFVAFAQNNVEPKKKHV